MHIDNPDLVSIKTAIRQLASRLENEAVATGHWARLAKNRGEPEVAVRLEEVVANLKTAYVNAEAAAARLVEAQEHEAEHEHHAV